jgi:hypothetical protein
MARYLARKRVKDELRAKGVRSIWPADISRAANGYLAIHGVELMAEAKAILTQS